MIRCGALVLLLAAGCSRSTAPSAPADATAPAPVASASVAPDGGLPRFRFGSGHSASGPGHYSVLYGAVEDGPGASALERADFARCYTASPLHAANGAVLLHVHVAIDAKGTATSTVKAFDGTLVDKGGGRQAWEIATEPSTKDAALVACAEAAASGVSFPEAARGTTVDFGVKLSP